MYLEKLIEKLEKARKVCRTNIEKKNVEINIKICEMQIKIRDKRKI
jgi:hypothetical protein